MWLLDKEVVSGTSDPSVILTFHSEQIGNRTLSYVAFVENNPQTLATVLISILPNTTQGNAYNLQ